MRNRIPEVAEEVVIEDFYRGSNDSAFVRAVLQKASITSEQLFYEANLYITADERAQDLTEEQSLHRQHCDATRTSNPTNVVRRGLVKKSTPPDHPPLAPEEDLAEANAHWTTSSTPSARTTRTCATPFGTTETSSIPWGTADPSNLCCLPHHEEDLENLDNPNSRIGEEVEPSHTSTEKSTSSSVDMGRKKARGNKSSTTVRYWWQPLDLPPRIDGPSTRSPSLGRISGSTSTTRASTRSSSIW
jgi:hypothetical protein